MNWRRVGVILKNASSVESEPASDGNFCSKVATIRSMSAESSRTWQLPAPWLPYVCCQSEAYSSIANETSGF